MFQMPAKIAEGVVHKGSDFLPVCLSDQPVILNDLSPKELKEIYSFDAETIAARTAVFAEFTGGNSKTAV